MELGSRGARALSASSAPPGGVPLRRPSPSGALAVTSRQSESSLGSRGPQMSLNLSGSPDSGSQHLATLLP
ncbi:unnamed protein product [Lampetra planeri]